MGNPAIIVGDVRSVMRLPPAAMKDVARWNQLDSDTVAHFFQVYGQLYKSRWRTSDLRYSGDEFTIPTFEDFVYAAVYFRQLIARKDNLLNDAADRYCQFVDCSIRECWIREEQKHFAAVLDGEPFGHTGDTVREVFDAFMYGASLMHKAPHLASNHRKRFLRLYDSPSRNKVLYALNQSLHFLLGPVSSIYTVIYRDIVEWTEQHNLPLPDVRWHDRLFNTRHRPGNGQ